MNTSHTSSTGGSQHGHDSYLRGPVLTEIHYNWCQSACAHPLCLRGPVVPPNPGDQNLVTMVTAAQVYAQNGKGPRPPAWENYSYHGMPNRSEAEQRLHMTTVRGGHRQHGYTDARGRTRRVSQRSGSQCDRQFPRMKGG